MKFWRDWLDSLYTQLALVFAFAILASFIAFSIAFQAYTDQFSPIVPGPMARDVQLVEMLLKYRQPEDIMSAAGMTLAPSPVMRNVRVSSTKQVEIKGLAEELQRPVVVMETDWNGGGYWVQLASQRQSWLYFAPAANKTWVAATISGFLIIVAGTLYVLWHLHVPMRRLASGMEEMETLGYASPLKPSGPSETRKLAQRFNAMAAHIKQTDEDRMMMLAGVAHDLKAPLTRLRLLTALENNSRQAAMDSSMDSIDAIIDQFLNFARRVEDEPRALVDLHFFTEDVVSAYFESGVTMLTSSETPMPVNVALVGLRRALCNLIENALEYGAPPVQVSCTVANGRGVITVMDHGPGIPPESFNKVTRPFARLDAARSNQGHCGLGLSIVTSVIAAHGGEFVLANNPDGGLNASLLVPLHVDPDEGITPFTA
jgi:two-component system osmolarity sensor histidine kinase EnvZ